jgi:hypothetical protein
VYHNQRSPFTEYISKHLPKPSTRNSFIDSVKRSWQILRQYPIGKSNRRVPKSAESTADRYRNRGAGPKRTMNTNVEKMKMKMSAYVSIDAMLEEEWLRVLRKWEVPGGANC